MTRYTQLMQAVDAVRDADAAASAPPQPELMSYVVVADNGGGFQWTIAAKSGETLAQSPSFASYQDAQAAARAVHAAAGLASFEERAGDTPPADLAAHRDKRRVRDDLDAERWLDEGGSVSSEVMTAWPARH